MRSLKCTLLLLLSYNGIYAQTVVDSLAQNFNTSCAASTDPSGWLIYTPVPGTSTNGGWECTPTDGRPTSTGSTTPGMLCTNVWGGGSGSYHLDTSFLVSPLLNFAGLSPTPLHVYLQFDARMSKIILGGRLAVLTKPSFDTTLFAGGADTDLTGRATPIIGETADSAGWVTHQIDLTSYISQGPFYIGFRFTGTDTSGSTWFLDNIETSTISLHTPELTNERTQLFIAGQSTSANINICFDATGNDNTYSISVYNILGQVVHTEKIYARGGLERYSIEGMNLRPGLYIVKVANSEAYSTAKTVVR